MNIRRRRIPAADGRDLELKLTSFGVEELEEYVVGALAIDIREVSKFSLCRPCRSGFGGLLAHFVVFIGGAFLTSSMVGFLRAAEAGDYICVRPMSVAQAIRPA